MINQFVKMSEVIDEISMGPFGSDIKVDNFVNEGVPVLNGANLPKFKLLEEEFRFVTIEKAKTFKKAIAKKGDIIITHRGTLGQISYIPDDSKYEEYVISQSQFRVSLNRKKVDPAFFVYYFHTSEGQKRLLANKCHVGVPALAQATTNFRLIHFPLPNLLTQKIITSVLLSLDRKIELNNKINSELELMAKTLYDYWFIQFDFPDENVKPYKASGGKMVWNDELKREIPKGWEVIKVENLLSKESSQIKTPSSEYDLCGRIPIIDQSTDFIAGYTNNQNAIIYGSVIPRIVFGDHTRVLKLINFDFVRGADGTQILLSNNKRIPQHVLYHSLLRIDLSNYGYARHFKFLKDSLVILPDINVANAYEKSSSSFYNLIKENIFQNIKLAEIRDWLMPMLMNGQVKVN